MTKQRAGIVAILAILMMNTGAYATSQSTQWALKMFEETSHDFGVVARGSDVRHRIQIKNIYKETIHIADVKTSCGCTAAKPSKYTLKSLETAYIEIVMNTKKFTHKKESSITITFDAPQRAEVRIPIAAYIRTDVVIEPGSVNFTSVDKGAGAEQTISISYAGRADWHLRGVENLPSYLKAEVSEQSRTRKFVQYHLKITLDKQAAIGQFRNQISLVTDDSSSPRIPLLVEGEVVSDIVVNPGVVSFGVLAPGQEKTSNVVIRGKQPFKITKVECESDLHAFKVRMPEDTKSVHVIPLTISTPQGAGTLVETFTVTIDGRDEPIIFKAYCKVVAGS